MLTAGFLLIPLCAFQQDIIEILEHNKAQMFPDLGGSPDYKDVSDSVDLHHCRFSFLARFLSLPLAASLRLVATSIRHCFVTI
jgi:hypothetical protein